MLTSLGIHFNYILENIIYKFFQITIFLANFLLLDFIIFKTEMNFPYNSTISMVHYSVALFENQIFNSFSQSVIIQSAVYQSPGTCSTPLGFFVTLNFYGLSI